jgi:hypothetical protein
MVIFTTRSPELALVSLGYPPDPPSIYTAAWTFHGHLYRAVAWAGLSIHGSFARIRRPQDRAGPGAGFERGLSCDGWGDSVYAGPGAVDVRSRGHLEWPRPFSSRGRLNLVLSSTGPSPVSTVRRAACSRSHFELPRPSPPYGRLSWSFRP